MTIEELAERCEQVRFNGQGFTARCPAHEDHSPSLSVRQGNTSILVKCFAGCDFFEICRVLGLKPQELKLGAPSLPVTGSAAMRLRRMKAKPDVRIDVVVTEALNPPKSAMASAWLHYPELAELPYHEAMRYWVILFDGPIFEMMLPILDATWPGWSKDKIKRDVFARLSEEARRQMRHG